MPVRRFALNIHSPREIEIRWKGKLQEPEEPVQVSYAGLVLGVVHSYEELLAGREFSLPDGSAIKIQAGRGTILVFRKGVCLNDILDIYPEVRAFHKYPLILAAANAAACAIWYFGIEVEANPAIAAVFLAFVLLHLALAFWVQQRLATAVVVAYIILVALNLVALAKWGQFSPYSAAVEFGIVAIAAWSIYALLRREKGGKEKKHA